MSRSWWLLCLARMVMGCSSPSSGPGRGHPEPLYNCRRPQWPGTRAQHQTSLTTTDAVITSAHSVLNILVTMNAMCLLDDGILGILVCCSVKVNNLSLILINEMIAGEGWWLSVVWSRVVPRQDSVILTQARLLVFPLSRSLALSLSQLYGLFRARHETNWQENIFKQK